ncbi:hypothetical protein [Ruania halotolerans]|uniref:hypothetical protein n=1 Tax=Ruania halotolerans TaxID=2897773 RepID=UPI001E636315|nr:hypothetical protein [Ruania halotolerans]UFU07413.1 hypothetical protein LQF10_04695 [Ruania halotolerans]
MSNPRPLPDDLRHAMFTVRHALDSGVHIERLRRDDLAAPFHGLRIPAPDELSLRERCLAYQVPRPDTFVSHLTAARLHGLPTPIRADERLDMAVLAPARAPRGTRIRGHRLNSSYTQVRNVRGLRIASPVSVWLHLADSLSLRELVILGDGWEIIDDEGRFLATADRQYSHDIDRLNGLAGAGWLVIRVNRSHYRRNLPAVIDQIQRTLIGRGWRPPTRSARALPQSVA